MEAVERELEQIIGQKVREYRKHSRITQDELAKRSGYTKSMISKIENGKISIPIATLSKLATALNVKLSFFFNEDHENVNLNIIKKNEGEFSTKSNNKIGYFYQKLASLQHVSPIETFLITVPPIVKGKEPYIHDADEFIYLVQGKIDLYYDGLKYPMEEGDSAYYKGINTHMFLPKDKKGAIVLAVIVEK